MNNAKLHGIVEYIRAQGEFPFNVEDVEEGLSSVLNFFNVFEALTSEEAMVLKEELANLALQEEEAEAVRLAFQMGLIDEEDIPSAKEENNGDDDE